MTHTSLESLRQAIDTIDDQIHDLLMRRVEVVAPIAALKAGEAGRDFVRPAREAELTRRLVARHSGPLPVDVVVRMWRELISAKLGLQGDFSVHVFGVIASDQAPDLRVWDLARAYYGAITPMTSHGTAQKLIRTIAETPGALGVMPIATGEARDPAWWQGLLSQDANPPRIIARLPFLDGPGAAIAYPPAYVLSCVEPAPSGDDTTVFALHAEPSVSRGRILAGLEASGMPLSVLATGEESGPSPIRHYLCELKGFHFGAEDDLRARLGGQIQGIQRITPIGAYANPIILDADGNAASAMGETA